MKKSICIFTLYPKEGASSNYRILMYTDDLKQDYDVKSFSFWNKAYVTKYIGNKKKYLMLIGGIYVISVLKRIFELMFIAPQSDIVILQKGILPWLPFTFMKYLKRKGCKIIFDVDDAIYTSKKCNSDTIATLANCVVVGNGELKKHFSEINKNVKIFPTVDYTPAYRSFVHDTFENKTIGWIGSKSSIGNLDLVVDAINEIVEKHPEVSFTLIAGTADGYNQKIKNTRFIKWSLDKYISEMSDFTIGIMPLYDNEFNRGKCGFKLIQYLNLEKPVIASPVGVNSEIVGKTGCLAGTIDEWVDCLEKLLFDSNYYKLCVSEIENSFFSKYDYKVVLGMWKELISNI